MPKDLAVQVVWVEICNAMIDMHAGTTLATLWSVTAILNASNWYIVVKCVPLGPPTMI